MKTFDDEDFILENYRLIPFWKIKFFGRLFPCWRILKLTKSRLFQKSWKNSSSKSDLPPDFHNDRHHTMMECMRVDDCINKIKEKHISNSFEKTNKFLKKNLGNDYRQKNKDVSLYFVPNTNNTEEFNFKGYIQNFERVIMKHSKKVSQYHSNYPKCKTTVFFICDESNNYIQVSKKEDLKKKDKVNPQLKNFLPHICYLDKRFIEIIKQCEADYVIWLGCYKSLFVNDKKIKYPRVCIYDVKYIRNQGYEYNHDLMFKVKEVERR